jgi:hypothetical protein
MTGRQTASATGSAPSIITPTIDLLLVGGLSLLAFIPMLASGATDLLMVGAGTQAFLATAINMPHFMASYRIVYRSRAMILRHKWASIYVPGILLVYIAAAIWDAQTSPVLVTILVTVSGAYLAWHYTGQVWGMMASYAHLAGTAFDKTERLLIRTSLRILLAWHVTWFLYTQLRDPSAVQPLYRLVTAGTIVALGLGATGLLRMRRRTGMLPPLRALVARDKNAIFWVQIAHALQYLAFPVRVEMNTAGAGAVERGRRLGVHMAAYAAGLLVLSYVAAQVIPGRAMDAVAAALGQKAGDVVPVLVLMFINIHHYFTDGVIWKISNPEVRNELFAHVRLPFAAPRRPAGKQRDNAH